jgi:hypothetical protein
MVLVDTSAWIEWLIGTATGDRVVAELPEPTDWLVPTIVPGRSRCLRAVRG